MSDLRRFVNDPEKVVEDELNGYLLVHGGIKFGDQREMLVFS